MPRPRKKGIDETDLEILCALYFLERGTAFEISKYTGLSRGLVSSRLQLLVEKKVIPKPEEVVTRGRIRKIYSTISKDTLVKLIVEWYKATKYLDLIEVDGKTVPAGPPEIEWKLNAEIPLVEQIYYAVDLANWIPITEAIAKFTALELFRLIEAGYVETQNSKVRLTELGKSIVVDHLKHSIQYHFSLLKQISSESAKNLIKELKTD